jgi:hypothetical protein
MYGQAECRRKIAGFERKIADRAGSSAARVRDFQKPREIVRGWWCKASALPATSSHEWWCRALALPATNAALKGCATWMVAQGFSPACNQCSPEGLRHMDGGAGL